MAWAGSASWLSGFVKGSRVAGHYVLLLFGTAWVRYSPALLQEKRHLLLEDAGIEISFILWLCCFPTG
jgi:hypothetical protein